MDPKIKAAIQAKLQAANLAYARNLPERIQEVNRIWEGLRAGPWERESLADLHRKVHTFAGSSGTFGLGAFGRAAREAEILLKEMVLLKGAPDGGLQSRLSERLANMESVARVSLAEKDVVVPQASDILPRASEEAQSLPLIFLVDDDGESLGELALQLKYYGYSVRSFTSLADFRAALAAESPMMTLMAMTLPDGDGPGALQELQAGRDDPLPVFFLSAEGGLDNRLRAVRAGGLSFFKKPVDITRLVDALDGSTGGADPEPPRILLVDDEKSLAEFFASHLTLAEMEARVVSEPLAVLEAVRSFRPDLILMDLYMPGASGLELARVIRQEESLVSVPIVFLSSETDVDKQLAAMSLGGDDFLTKPIQPDHLVVAVASRVKRSRILRAHMVRDSLTGLYNHTRIGEHLEQEIARASRSGAPLCFAMVDIDKFKKVNDTYGHPTGDRVIKSLARVLSQRLRQTDVVGRYGGEEFAVILPDTDGAAAGEIMDELREAFAKICHEDQGAAFTCTFSCGIAVYPTHADPGALKEAADQALYRAKEGGRNRVALDGR